MVLYFLETQQHVLKGRMPQEKEIRILWTKTDPMVPFPSFSFLFDLDSSLGRRAVHTFEEHPKNEVDFTIALNQQGFRAQCMEVRSEVFSHSIPKGSTYTNSDYQLLIQWISQRVID